MARRRKTKRNKRRTVNYGRRAIQKANRIRLSFRKYRRLADNPPREVVRYATSPIKKRIERRIENANNKYVKKAINFRDRAKAISSTIKDISRPLTCLKRRVRKEIIFATGKAGSGKTRKRPKYGPESKIKC